ncbi:hypothetical protein INR49_006356 [Caranx melampygus]|nr:hypothetical protein INR49_006356 [Caranx melampygus]
MDGLHQHFSVRTSLSFLLLILLQTSTEAVEICSVPVSVDFPEDNAVGEPVTTITADPGVVITISPGNDANLFRIEGHNLIAAVVLDYEAQTTYTVQMACTKPATPSQRFTIVTVVLLKNKNDHPPVFVQNPYRINVPELSPVGENFGTFAATDEDEHVQLTYTLTSESNGFELRSPTSPELLVKTPLNYDKVKSVQLVLTAVDEPLLPGDTLFTATTTIIVTILDKDNRPPWFQPCTMQEIGETVVCQSAGYTGSVDLNEQEAGPLPLKPGPLKAIDGDSGLKEPITYSILSGNDDGLFRINADTGEITMQKAATKLGTITLTVLAAQRINSHQFATTTVTITVKPKSLHPPKFQKLNFEAVVTGVGSMAMDPDTETPLQIVATDEDYASSGGVNPYITYSVIGSNAFSIIDGHLFMIKPLPDETLSLQVEAKDTSNNEAATAALSVEVTLGLSTTTEIMTSTSTAETTTDSKTTEVIVPSGDYGVVDMAVLGATLGVLLFICLVVIGLLICRMQKGKADWRKIYETNVFRSSLGQGSGGPKEGIQYTNEAFQHDEDKGSVGSSGSDSSNILIGRELQKAAETIPQKETFTKTAAPLHAFLPDDTSQAGSDDADSEKEVKPILTKERRMEEGYKSVWFKEDIDPSAREEVVIIPDSREDDSEEDEEEEQSTSRKAHKVGFADADMDSGLGVKMGDSAEDSDVDVTLTSDL